MKMIFKQYIRGRIDREHLNFYLLVLLVVSTFFLGGASRNDVVSLVLLRPLTAIVLIYAVIVAGRSAWHRQWQLIALAILIVSVVALHLVPLPGEIWRLLPGREAIVANFVAVGQELPWLPISLTPLAAWNALFSLMGPFAALLLILTLPQHYLITLLKLVLALGACSALIGLAQILGPPTGPLYLYRITNNGIAVGLFANRNHHAVFLATLFPLMTVWLARYNLSNQTSGLTLIIIIAIGVFIFPLLLATGSRAGLLLGLFALIASTWVYHPVAAQGMLKKADGIVANAKVIAAGVICLGLAILMMSRTSAFQRLISFDSEEEARIQAFSNIWEATVVFFPIGSGFGSFPEVYQMFETQEQLSPYYLNHAHNDIIEIAMTGGLPGIILMLLSLMYLMCATWRLANARPTNVQAAKDTYSFLIVIGRSGIVGLIILALASFVDYPLRIPSISILMVIFVAFVVAGWQAKHLGTPS